MMLATYKKIGKRMSKKRKNTPAGLLFSGAKSATLRFQPGSDLPEVSIPEQSRPRQKDNGLFANQIRSIVGHSFVKSHTFTIETTGKGYGRKNN